MKNLPKFGRPKSNHEFIFSLQPRLGYFSYEFLQTVLNLTVFFATVSKLLKLETCSVEPRFSHSLLYRPSHQLNTHNLIFRSFFSCVVFTSNSQSLLAPRKWKVTKSSVGILLVCFISNVHYLPYNISRVI